MTVVDAFQSGNADRWIMPPRPTVGVITTVGTYEQYVPHWATSVRGLRRQPDQVVIVAQDAPAVQAITAKELPQATVLQAEADFQFATYLNQAVDACHTDWIAWIGVDDRYRPQALNGLDIIETDVYIYGMAISDGRTWRGDDLAKAPEHNPVPCGSPFRRWIWEAIPFQPHLAPFEDWAFWVGANHLGATAKQTGRIDFDYRIHPEQIVPPQEPHATRVREWAATLTR